MDKDGGIGAGVIIGVTVYMRHDTQLLHSGSPPGAHHACCHASRIMHAATRRASCMLPRVAHHACCHALRIMHAATHVAAASAASRHLVSGHAAGC